MVCLPRRIAPAAGVAVSFIAALAAAQSPATPAGPGAPAPAVVAGEPQEAAATEPPIAPALPANRIPDAPTLAPSALEPGTERGLVLPAFAGDPATPLGNETLFESLTPLRRAWFVREYYRRRGDEPKTEKTTEALVELRLDSGIENATSIAAALAAEARADLAEGKAAAAVSAATAATKMAPDFSGAWTTLARARISDRQVGPALSAALEAVRATFRNLRSRLGVLGNAGLAVLAGLLAAQALFLVSAFVRYAFFLAHDFRHALADDMPAWLAAIILVPFLAFPLVFGAGLAVLLAWWTVVLWTKLMLRERIVAALFLAAGAATPAALERIAVSFAFEGGDAGRLFAAVREDELSPRDADLLAALAAETNDPAVLLTLGIAHQRAGRYGIARDFYARARDAGAADTGWVGLGNVHYALGEIPQAIAAFEKALQVNPASVAAHFNLSQIHAESTALSKATASLDAAKRLDTDRCERFIRLMLPPARKSLGSGEAGAATPPVAAAYVNRFLMVEPISDAALLERAAGGARSVAERSWAEVSPSVPLRGVTGVFAAALLLCGILTVAFHGAVPSRPCPRCGRRLCLRCDGPPLEEDYCVQCFHAFIDDEGVDPRQRAAKELEIQRFQARRRRHRRLLSLFVPGSGHLFEGETVRGTLLVVLASLAAVRLLFWRGFFRPAFPLPGTITPIAVAALSGGVLVLAWIAAVRSHPGGAKGGG